ncbi:hypothetical protein YEEN111655_10355 [Yersinia entomophaga]|uniref:Uncharacterized protein n=1 Tax=Yersinia nurmii TaxID=685706 RepID=A0ABP1Y643_9GAMM|nr:Uncharacterised protein [Yersinia nurmii]
MARYNFAAAFSRNTQAVPGDKCKFSPVILV